MRKKYFRYITFTLFIACFIAGFFVSVLFMGLVPWLFALFCLTY